MLFLTIALLLPVSNILASEMLGLGKQGDGELSIVSDKIFVRESLFSVLMVNIIILI